MSLRFIDLEASNSKKQGKSQYRLKTNFFSFSSDDNNSQKLSPIYSSRNISTQAKSKTAKQGRFALNLSYNKLKTITFVILLFILIMLCIGYLLDSTTKSQTKSDAKSDKKSGTKSEKKSGTKSDTRSEKKSGTKSDTKSEKKSGKT